VSDAHEYLAILSAECQFCALKVQFQFVLESEINLIHFVYFVIYSNERHMVLYLWPFPVLKYLSFIVFFEYLLFVLLCTEGI
jgi:hypothetical protein